MKKLVLLLYAFLVIGACHRQLDLCTPDAEHDCPGLRTVCPNVQIDHYPSCGRIIWITNEEWLVVPEERNCHVREEARIRRTFDSRKFDWAACKMKQ